MSAAPRFLSFHYTLRDERGSVLDTSRGNAPMACIEGAGQVIEGMEEALRAMAAGERRAIVVPPEKGYGLPDEALVQAVPLAALPVGEVKVGDQFQTGPDRHDPIVTVVAVEGDQVRLDANHPLAGRTLHFDVELVEVRAATAAELAAVRAE